MRSAAARIVGRPPAWRAATSRATSPFCRRRWQPVAFLVFAGGNIAHIERERTVFAILEPLGAIADRIPGDRVGIEKTVGIVYMVIDQKNFAGGRFALVK